MNYYLFSVMYMAVLGYLGSKAKISKTLNLIFMILTATVVNIPIKNLSINMITYSFVGEMSIFLFTLCVLGILQNLRSRRENLLDLKSYIFISIFGFVLYIGVLYVNFFNLYYQDFYYIIVVCCFICIIAYFVHRILGIIYLICLLSYGLDLMVSRNLFDYFIDATTWLFSIVSVCVMIFKRILRK